MKNPISQIVFAAAFGAAAFGAAIAAGAQTPEGGTVPVVPDPNPTIMPSVPPGGDNARQQALPPQDRTAAKARDKVEANGQGGHARACADLPEADVNGCLARDDAAKTKGEVGSKASTSSNGKNSGDKTSNGTDTGSTGSSAASTTSGNAATQK